MELQAYGKNILIECEAVENTTKSGLILSTKDEATQNKGTIVSKGDEVGEKLQIGARVVFRKYARSDFKAGEKTYAIVHEDDILLHGN